MTDQQEMLRELYAAIARRDTERARDLFERCPSFLGVETPNGTWLHVAARSGDSALVRYLTEAGLDVNKPGGRSGSTPINFAASEGNVNIVEYLIGHGAILDTSKPETNPLFSAVHRNHIEVARRLIRHGIDVTIDYDGRNAVSFAKALGHQEMAELLSTACSADEEE